MTQANANHAAATLAAALTRKLPPFIAEPAEALAPEIAKLGVTALGQMLKAASAGNIEEAVKAMGTDAASIVAVKKQLTPLIEAMVAENAEIRRQVQAVFAKIISVAVTVALAAI